MCGDEGEPDILANRHADLHPAKIDGRGQRSGREEPLFIERAVIGKLPLGAHRRDGTIVEQGNDIEEHTLRGNHRAHQHGRAAIGGFLRHPVKLIIGLRDQSGFQHQILGRITDQLQLGKDDQVSPLRPRAPFQHGVGVSLEVAHGLGHLRKRDHEFVGHGARPSAFYPKAQKRLSTTGSPR